MFKYSHKRIDIAQSRNKYNQTYRHVLPVLSLWADGIRYNMVGIQLAWWKWAVNFFFKIDSKGKQEVNA